MPADPPTRLAPEELARVQERRELFNLDPDPELISRLAGDPSAPTAWFGVPVTLDEQAELERRDAVRHQMCAALDVVTAVPWSFAGAWFDDDREGVVLHISGRDPDALSRLLDGRDLVPSGHGDRVVFHEVEFSAERLEACRRTLSMLQASKKGIGQHIWQLGIGVKTNRVEVHVDEETPETLIAETAQAFPLAVIERGANGWIEQPAPRYPPRPFV